jgi:hypothetical protein
MSITSLLILFAMDVALTILAAFVVERSITAALRGLKLALKSELTSDVGKLNLISMVLIVFVMVVFNLHQMVSDALRVESVSRTGDHVIGPATLVSFFFIGSLICVMLMERKK